MSVTPKQQTPNTVSLKQMNQHIASSLAGVLLPLGEKPQNVKRKSAANKSTSKKSGRTTLSSNSTINQSHKYSLPGKRDSPHSLSIRPGRNLWSASSMMSTFSNVSDGPTFDEDQSNSVMQRQPKATVSALMRYRGIAPSASTELNAKEKTTLSDAEFDIATRGNEPWEMLRSVCPEPSKKFATIHHLSKSKVTWESLTQSLLHSTNRYNKEGQQFSTFNALLIARGSGETSFIDSLLKTEERLKASLGCVEWNPFPVDYWISKGNWKLVCGGVVFVFS